MSDLQKLRNVILLNLLNDEELQIFQRACDNVFAKEREVIFNEDDPGDTLYLITTGRVQISKRTVEDQEEMLPVILEGDIFGEMAFIDGTPRSSTATALDACELYSIKRDGFDQLLKDKPEMAFKIMLQMSRILTARLRDTSERVKEGILWNLQISGASALSMQHLISSKMPMEIELTNGKRLTGRILLVVKTETGYQITVKDQGGRLYIVPYGAINYISVSEDDFKNSVKENK